MISELFLTTVISTAAAAAGTVAFALLFILLYGIHV